MSSSHEVLSLIPEHEVLTQKEISSLKELTAKHTKEIVTSNIKYTNRQKYQNYYIYLKKAITEDYAEKDRKISEMKSAERKVYEDKVKQEEDEAAQREQRRKQAVRIYQTLPDGEREALEAQIEEQLEKDTAVKNVKHIKILYENIKLSKIVEQVISKYMKLEFDK